MNSKEALETLGNVKVAVSNIRTGRTFVKTLKEEYEKEFEVLGKEILFVRDIKPFDVYEKENEKLKKVIEILKSYDLRVEYVEGYYTQPIIKFNHTYNEGIVGITIEEYDLLKEYLWAE